MNRLAAAVLICLSSAALAQESAPPPPPQFENPYAAPAPQPVTRAGSFGIKAGFGTSLLPINPSTGVTVNAAAPAFGFKWIAAERLALSIDFGLTLAFGTTLRGSVSAATGLDIYLGSLTSPLRPFVTAGVGLAKPLTTLNDDWSVVLNTGFGAEHWFTDHFSLSARLLLVLPVDLSGRTYSVVSTFVPAVGAVFYF